MIDPRFPGRFALRATSLTAAAGTQARILVDESPANILAAISGETALPGESGVRQRILEGGCRVIDGSISSTDGTARSALIFLGSVLTRLSSGTNTITGQNVLTRASGSFLADGWRVGEAAMIFDGGTAANDGVLVQVTAVAETTLTVSGTPWTNSAGLAGTARVIRVAQRTCRALPANCGNADATPAVALMGGTQDPAAAALPDTGYSLGPADVLIVGLAAACSALPARIDFNASLALY